MTDNQWSPHIHINTQTSSNPATREYVEEFIEYRLGSRDIFGEPKLYDLVTSRNTGVFDREYVNNDGTVNFGTLSNPGNTYAGVHWYYAYDPYHRYRGDQPTVAATCYAQDYEGGTFRRSIIVYDALGGARRAYTVRTGFFQDGLGVRGTEEDA